MDYAKTIEALEQEWSKPDGFFGKLREGSFDAAGLKRLENVLAGIEPSSADSIPRRLVSLTWFAPLFMKWQRERVEADGGDLNEFDLAVTRIENAVEEVLGVP